jgi:hypothetical protein
VLSTQLNSILLGTVLAIVPLWAGAADPTSEQTGPEAASVAPGETPEALLENAGYTEPQETGAGPSQEAATQPGDVRYRKAKDGSGYGSGLGGERGQGIKGAPHHQQYASPPRGTDESNPH